MTIFIELAPGTVWQSKKKNDRFETELTIYRDPDTFQNDEPLFTMTIPEIDKHLVNLVVPK